MSFHPLRSALYAALAIFSIVLLGLSAARIHYTNTASGINDPLRGRLFSHFYDPIVVELLVTSILALLWSLYLMYKLARKLTRGVSFLTELIGLSTLWVMYLVGAAIYTRKFHRVGFCRGFFTQCRVLTGIEAFSWICFAITTFLLLASILAMLTGRHDPHGRNAATTAGATAGGTGYHHNHAAPGTETRAVGGTGPVTTGNPLTADATKTTPRTGGGDYAAQQA